MKLTMLEITNGYQALVKMVDENLPIIIAITNAANLKALEGHVKIFDDARTKLVQKYAVKNEKGEPIKSANDTYEIENPEEFNQEFQALMGTELEVQITQIDPAAFQDTKISTADAVKMAFMFS